MPSGTRFCNPHAEIAGARSDIGDKRSALQMQDVQNLLRLLPGVAFRIIELFGPFLRIGGERLIDLMSNRCGKLPNGRQPRDACQFRLRRGARRNTLRLLAGIEEWNNGNQTCRLPAIE